MRKRLYASRAPRPPRWIALIACLEACAVKAVPMPVVTTRSRVPQAVEAAEAPRMLAASVSAIGEGAGERDALWLVFSLDIDPASVVADRFAVVLRGGDRVTPDEAHFGPADEGDENRSVILRGAFRVDGAVAVEHVQVVGALHGEDGSALLGVEHGVDPADEPDRMVHARPGTAAECGEGRRTVQTFWSDALADVGPDDLARVTVTDAAGVVHPVLAFADHAGTSGAAGGTIRPGVLDDNVLALCVGEDVRAATISVEAGTFADLQGRPTRSSKLSLGDR